MMKKFIYILPLMAGMLFATACEDDYRDPSGIVNDYMDEYKEMLASSEYGWRFDYYPDTTQYGAFNLWMQFAENGRVKMQVDKNLFYLFASEEDLAKGYDWQESDYTIQNSQGPVLTFATYSLLHKLSDPTFDEHNFGSGWAGDFEFVLMGHSEAGDTIYLKSVRAQKSCYIVKNTVDPNEDIKKLNKVIDEFTGGDDVNVYFRDMIFSGQEDSVAVLAGFDMISRSGVIYQMKEDKMVADTCAVYFSTKGVHLSKPIQVNGVEVKEFIYDEEQNDFLINGQTGHTIKMAENGLPKFQFPVRKEVFRGMYEYISGRDTIMREDNYQLAYNPKSAEDEWKVLYESLENYAMMAMFADDASGSQYIFAIYDQYQDKSGRTVPCLAQCPLNYYWDTETGRDDMVAFIGAATSSLVYASQNENYVYQQGTDLSKEYQARIEKPLKSYLTALFGSAFTPVKCIIVPSPDYESFSFVNVADGTSLVINKY
ncbi:MAG: DUF4302 domain-containing protein [Bacteroidaceae bacterium]|nr:DUF4302 domain-containing protein [Bacteroidaceae bacterium]